MRTKIILSLFAILMVFATAEASFPVKRAKAQKTQASELTVADNTMVGELYSPAAAALGDDLVVGVLLWFFLGALAGHRWYYGKPIGWNILFILTAGGLGVWWIIDLINMLSGNF